MSAGATPLARLQVTLLKALLLPDAAQAGCLLAGHLVQGPERGALGLRAYRQNALGTAQRALTAVFPTVQALLSETSFAALASDFWQRHPPGRGDLAQWGDALPAFLATAPSLADEAYLADVARVEWALHQAATAPDAVADLASLACLVELAPELVGLRLAPGTCCRPSPWPVVSLIEAHRLGGPEVPEASGAWARLRERLQGPVAETALVWRQGLKPCLRAADAGEPALVQALAAGCSLADALAQALAAAPEFDFSRWLNQAVHSGLVTAAFPRPPEDMHHG